MWCKFNVDRTTGKRVLNSVSVMVVWGSWVGFLGLGFLVDEACLGFWVGALYINIAE